MDRAGLVFRMSAAEMFKRLRLGSHLPSWSNSQENSKRAFTRNAWGCFALERFVDSLNCVDTANRFGSLIAFAYLQPSLIPVPTIPRHFAKPEHSLPFDPTRLLGLNDVLNAHSDISIILYQICKYKPESIGEDCDIRIRSELYDALRAWQIALPTKELFENTQIQQYHYLRYVICCPEQIW